MASSSLLADKDIRPILRVRFAPPNSPEKDTVLVEELGVCQGQGRIDMAVVNGSLHGIEIKSDRDSLRRLAGQVEMFGEILDFATLVVGERHLVDALKIIPKWWEVLRVEATFHGPKLKRLRHGCKNPSRNARSLVELLWLEEAIELLEKRNAAHGVRGKTRDVVWDRVCQHFSLDEIADTVRDRLKARAEKPAPLKQL
jgi:hypothetical protein